MTTSTHKLLLALFGFFAAFAIHGCGGDSDEEIGQKSSAEVATTTAPGETPPPTPAPTVDRHIGNPDATKEECKTLYIAIGDYLDANDINGRYHLDKVCALHLAFMNGCNEDLWNAERPEEEPRWNELVQRDKQMCTPCGKSISLVVIEIDKMGGEARSLSVARHTFSKGIQAVERRLDGHGALCDAAQDFFDGPCTEKLYADLEFEAQTIEEFGFEAKDGEKQTLLEARQILALLCSECTHLPFKFVDEYINAETPDWYAACDTGGYMEKFGTECDAAFFNSLEIPSLVEEDGDVLTHDLFSRQMACICFAAPLLLQNEYDVTCDYIDDFKDSDCDGDALMSLHNYHCPCNGNAGTRDSGYCLSGVLDDYECDEDERIAFTKETYAELAMFAHGLTC